MQGQWPPVRDTFTGDILESQHLLNGKQEEWKPEKDGILELTVEKTDQHEACWM